MIIDFGIRITDENGDPVSGVEVLVHYPWAMDSGVTDEAGWVRFTKSQIFGDAALTSIFVNGELRADSIWIENGVTLAYSV
jgi:hypothetical protein